MAGAPLAGRQHVLARARVRLRRQLARVDVAQPRQRGSPALQQKLQPGQRSPCHIRQQVGGGGGRGRPHILSADPGLPTPEARPRGSAVVPKGHLHGSGERGNSQHHGLDSAQPPEMGGLSARVQSREHPAARRSRVHQQHGVPEGSMRRMGRYRCAYPEDGACGGRRLGSNAYPRGASGGELGPPVDLPLLLHVHDHQAPGGADVLGQAASGVPHQRPRDCADGGGRRAGKQKAAEGNDAVERVREGAPASGVCVGGLPPQGDGVPLRPPL
mmetsp:Transcript_47743/g.91274  ORF Transcript_47743/g.91274 Transcript_47743/m.91274 type:complete len:272 (-) Transcript_47743:1074-1889(-)